MKKLIVLILATVAMSSQAAQIVSIVWPFNIGSTQANYARALVTEANKTQNKFTFVLENKTGAGSSIAANYVANSRELSIMAANAGSGFVYFIAIKLDWRLTSVTDKLSRVRRISDCSE